MDLDFSAILSRIRLDQQLASLDYRGMLGTDMTEAEQLVVVAEGLIITTRHRPRTGTGTSQTMEKERIMEDCTLGS